jgi:hypothetical protein
MVHEGSLKLGRLFIYAFVVMALCLSSVKAEELETNEWGFYESDSRLLASALELFRSNIDHLAELAEQFHITGNKEALQKISAKVPIGISNHPRDDYERLKNVRAELETYMRASGLGEKLVGENALTPEVLRSALDSYPPQIASQIAYAAPATLDQWTDYFAILAELVNEARDGKRIDHLLYGAIEGAKENFDKWFFSKVLVEKKQSTMPFVSKLRRRRAGYEKPFREFDRVLSEPYLSFPIDASQNLKDLWLQGILTSKVEPELLEQSPEHFKLSVKLLMWNLLDVRERLILRAQNGNASAASEIDAITDLIEKLRINKPKASRDLKTVLQIYKDWATLYRTGNFYSRTWVPLAELYGPFGRNIAEENLYPVSLCTRIVRWFR